MRGPDPPPAAERRGERRRREDVRQRALPDQATRSATLKVKLTKAGRKALRRKRKLPVTAVVSSGGTSWTLKLTLKRARR